MTKPCAVPTCKTGNRSEKSKRSVFRVPKDIERLKKWIEIIPGIVELKPTHVICDKHFEDKYIIREWIKRDESGRVIAQVPYKYPQLSKLAVPTRFSNDETNNETSTESSLMIPVINSVHHDRAMPVESPVNQSTEGTMITDTPHMQDVCIQLPISEDGQSLTTMEVADIGSTTMTNSTSDLHTEIASAPLSECQTQDKLFHIHSVFSERIQKGNANISACETDFATIPKFWSVGELPVQKGQCILFSYTIPRSDGGMHFPLTQKHVVLDTDRQLQYYVNGCHVNTQETELEQMYNTADLMPYILEKFQKMNVCSGLGDIDVHCVPANTAFQDGAKQWRHKKCSMISKTKKCNNCTKLRKCILQQVSRMKNCPTLHRIRKLHNPVDEYKIKAMRMKRRREKNAKNRANLRINLLMQFLKNKEDQMVRIEETMFDDKCLELNVPATQKAVMKEIIGAAKTSAKGRRYTEEWIMLCMLMNIRSPGYYEFLRRNNVLPLPCTRTIRGYFSLINMKCGFDNQFAELLKEKFTSKKTYATSRYTVAR